MTGGSTEGGLVLVVDDEEPVRRMLVRMLNRLGYPAETAEDGVEALTLFERDPGRYRAVILDLSMPRMSGPETLAALDRVRPEMPVALVSGYDVADTLKRLPPGRAVELLPKPFTMNDLRAMLDRMAALEK
jgi:CheY-like chemotaxis protein